MRKPLYILVLICLSACGQRGGKYNAISTIPSFNLLLMDSATVINTNQIQKGAPVVLMYFSPDCEHCQIEIQSLVKNAHLLGDTKIYLFTPAPFDELKAFYKTNNLGQYRNFVVGKDYEYAFYKHFKAESFPYTVVYDSQRKLVRLYKSEIEISNILEAIKI